MNNIRFKINQLKTIGKDLPAIQFAIDKIVDILEDITKECEDITNRLLKNCFAVPKK